MTTRIVKTEKFIPANGDPVFQVTEETTLPSGQVMRLDPRNPTPEELVDANESFAASQQLLIATLEADLSAANARIASLLNGMPWNPRVIDAEAFFKRLTLDEFARLSTSDDPVKVDIAKTIMQYKAPENDWPVIFESTEFQQMMGYLLQSGEITEQRMAELTRDSTREESYVADE